MATEFLENLTLRGTDLSYIVFDTLHRPVVGLGHKNDHKNTVNVPFIITNLALIFDFHSYAVRVYMRRELYKNLNTIDHERVELAKN